MELMTIKNNFWLIKIVPKALWERMIREQLATLFDVKKDKEERLLAHKDIAREANSKEEDDLEYLPLVKLKEKCDDLWITYKPYAKKDELISLLK